MRKVASSATATPIDDEERSKSDGKRQRGIQSVEVGARLLQAIAAARRPVGLTDLGVAADLPPAQAFTYLVSLSRIGLVRRDPVSGDYEPGPLALRLGLLRLEQTAAYRAAMPHVLALAQTVGYSVAVCMPGPQGPTIVRYEHAGFPLHVNLHIGTVMSLQMTTTGRVFCAFASAEQRQIMLASQLGSDIPDQARQAGQAALDATFEKHLAEIRQRGMERSMNTPSPGISSLCAPVFDRDGQLCLALTIIGASGSIDVEWDGPVATALERTAKTISGELAAVL
ncbi:transcriptional regulator, IclR family [Collimonas sp. OK242]|jgi:DNA-binding IclR family transcriptional regulator|uniref:IclR family transcriptional regulator n=1 Tax=Collimonas sp. OK242 TaxID=1798195 RepID=UPI0008944C69|nr:IclR family transcriptional regulator [Collimonas sp. OK242]SDX71307.1 transcriptional regulator, IclR family [Collimonas sp. OK242]